VAKAMRLVNGPHADCGKRASGQGSPTIHRCTTRRTPYGDSPLTCECPYNKIAPARWRRVAWSQPNLTSLHLTRQSLRHDAEAFPHPARHSSVTPPTPPIRNPGLPAPPHPVPCRPPLNPVPLPYGRSLYKPRATEDGWLRPRNPRQGHELPLPCGNLSRRARHGIGTSLGCRHQPRSHAESSQPLKAPRSGQAKPRFSWKVFTGQPP
jgi:hypothetical protein